MSIETTDEPRARKSTTVRLFAVPGPVRALFRSMEYAAPGLGARWAERIWFTLPEHAPRGTPTEPGRLIQVSVGGHRVAAETWGEGPPVLLLHGWAGNRGQFGAFVPALVARGYRVVAIDAPSHGDSAPGAFGPRSSSIPEFAEALQAVASQTGPVHAIVAHSLGCSAAAVSLCDGLSARRVVMISPMANPVTYVRQLGAVLGFGERTHRRLVVRVERRVGAPMRHFDIPELGRAIAMPKTLIVHDRDDVATTVADGEAIAAAWTGSRLHLTSGLGHRRILSDPGVVGEIVDFIAG
jgi:pimeloyl-ACP methyl ester carboxylesterase